MIRRTCSSLSLQWAEAPSPSRVVEYAAFYAIANEHRAARQPERATAPRRADGKRPSTSVELRFLHSGTEYEITIHALGADGWGPPSARLVVRTMRPADFPVPLPPPTVVGPEGCTALRLRMPVLETCDADEDETGRTTWDLEVSRDTSDDWRVLVSDTAGGQVSAVGLDAYATVRFRLTSHTPLPNRPTPKVGHASPNAHAHAHAHVHAS